MAYTTEKSFEGWIDVPFVLPQTELLGNEWLIVGSLCLPDGSSFEWRAAQVRIVGSSGLAVTGTVSLCLIRDFNPAVAPWEATLTADSGTPTLLEASLSVAYPYNCAKALAARDVVSPLEINTPGLYSLVLGFQINDPTGALDPLQAAVTVAVAAQGRLVFAS